MTNLRQAANALSIGLTLIYPAAVYFGLQVFEPRTLGLLLLTVILLRHWRAAEELAAGVRMSEWAVFAVLCGLAVGIMVSNMAGLLLFYPVAVSLSMLAVFGRTLVYPPTMIERIARLKAPDLDENGVRYTRKVTLVWCGFFVINAAISAMTAFGPHEYWALYNGLISYLLMGSLFLGEWLVRKSMLRRNEQEAR